MFRSLINRNLGRIVTTCFANKPVVNTTRQMSLFTNTSIKTRFSLPTLPSSISSTLPTTSLSSVRYSSTMKKRRLKMNKHKLKKRRKLLRMNTKVSRN